MSTTTASPRTLANDATIGFASWANASNAASSNNSYASVATASAITNYLKATNFDFSALPADITILGITVSVERKADDTVNDSEVKLVKAGTIQSTNKATGTAWPAADAVATYGGAADLWSGTWTRSDVTNSGFGVVIAVAGSALGQAYIDHITISIDWESNESVGSTLSTQARLLRP